jgi:hypothetical protein
MCDHGRRLLQKNFTVELVLLLVILVVLDKGKEFRPVQVKIKGRITLYQS